MECLLEAQLALRRLLTTGLVGATSCIGTVYVLTSPALGTEGAEPTAPDELALSAPPLGTAGAEPTVADALTLLTGSTRVDKDAPEKPFTLATGEDHSQTAILLDSQESPQANPSYIQANPGHMDFGWLASSSVASVASHVVEPSGLESAPPDPALEQNLASEQIEANDAVETEHTAVDPVETGHSSEILPVAQEPGVEDTPEPASENPPVVQELPDGEDEDSEASEASETIPTPAERSEVFAQAAFLQQGADTSARLRVGGIYVLSPSVFAGATVDLATGEAFADTDQTGLSVNELYLTASPANLPELRFTIGQLDLTSYLDRNSFAKDSLTQFFNPVFQTNPALSAVNVSSRPAILVNWTPIDQLSLTAASFSSRRGLGDFSLDSFAGEVGVRWGNAIVRGTYVSSRDGGQGDGFQEIFSFDRGNGQFGPLPGDREESFGLNAEYYIPAISLGLFGRYGWYTNVDLGVSGQTYSLGVNALDVFLPEDRLGLGYGRQLSNNALRQAAGDPVPDVWELFYDAEIFDNLRAGVSLQQRNAWTETYLGFRVRYDLLWNDIVREGE